MEFCIAVILNYKKSELTEACVKSLINQVEGIVIVDNSDSTKEYNKCHDKIKNIETKIKIILLKANSNLGFSKGIQYGIENQNIEKNVSHWLIINNDAIAGKNMVDQLKRALSEHQGLALAAPTNVSAMWYQPWLGLITKKKIWGATPYLSGACLLAPNILTKPFLFDPEFFMYGEDVELSWRLKKNKIALIKVDGATCFHENSSSSQDGSLFYEYYVNTGHFLLSKKMATGKIDYIIKFTFRLIILFFRSLLRCYRKKNINSLIALIHAAFRIKPKFY